MLINEFGIDPARLASVVHYDGTPITARFIVDEIQLAISKAQLSAPSAQSAVVQNAKSAAQLTNV
jgi:2-oxoglutarate ferredoxin oxidoreductase subunit alpha